jgi:hypothetical protein
MTAPAKPRAGAASLFLLRRFCTSGRSVVERVDRIGRL